MTGQHRNPRPSLLKQIGERLSRVGDRRIRAITNESWDQPYPTGMTDQFDEHTARGPIVLDHPHRLDEHGTCSDIRCQFRAGDDPATQTVVDVPAGEPEFRNAYGPVN